MYKLKSNNGNNHTHQHDQIAGSTEVFNLKTKKNGTPQYFIRYNLLNSFIKWSNEMSPYKIMHGFRPLAIINPSISSLCILQIKVSKSIDSFAHHLGSLHPRIKKTRHNYNNTNCILISIDTSNSPRQGRTMTIRGEHNSVKIKIQTEPNYQFGLVPN